MNKIFFGLFFFIISATGEQSHQHNHSYYTCSMHPEIRQDGPGKCPICGMNLTKIEPEDEEEDVSDTVASGSQTQQHNHSYYTCSMHPEIRQDGPGKCPICGMNLTKIEPEDEEEDTDSVDSEKKEISSHVGKVKIKKSQLKHFHPSFFAVTSMEMKKSVRLLGTVLQSENKERNIPARIGGRVEKVYVKSTGSLIKTGDPVVALYSPKLITAGEEYLVAKSSYQKSNSKDFQEMLTQAEEKLKLWGIKSFQYRSWYKKNSVPKQIIIYSPTTGIVKKRNAIVGRYFKEGQNFFELHDLSSVWVEIDIYEQDANLVKLGQQVSMEFVALPGQSFSGEIDFIHPVLDTNSRTLKVRATIPNPDGKLKPGMIADINLHITLEGTPLVIPRTAIIDTGKRKVVWVRVTDKKFQAQVIQSGYESDGYVEIKKGLEEGDKVVLDGSFLLDAQAQLFGGYQVQPNG